MGTSSIFNGQTKSNPLLPPDYSDGDDSQVEPNAEDSNEEPNNQSGTPNIDPLVPWSTVKSNFSKYINASSRGNGTSGGSLSAVARQYVRASGGTRAIISQAKSGLSSGKALISLFYSLNSVGLKQTLSDLHIQFKGKGVNELMSQLINAISPNSVTKEDIVARKATQDALAHIYDFMDRNGMDVNCLEKMPQNLVDEAMCAYLESYIWGLMLKDLESRIEKYESSPNKAEKIEKDLKGFTKGIVEVEFDKDKEIFKKSPAESVVILMEKCFKAIEGIV